MRLFIFAVCILFTPLLLAEWSPQQMHQSDRILGHLTKNIVKTLENKYSLRCCGQGVAAFGGPIRLIGYSFQTNKPYTKEELRRLLIDSVDLAMHIVQQTPNLDYYLANPPFTRKDLTIAIFLRNANGGDVYSPDIRIAKIDDRGLAYWYIPVNDRYDPKIVKETYEEALDAIKKEEEGS